MSDSEPSSTPPGKGAAPEAGPPARDPAAFYAELVMSLDARRAELSAAEQSFGANRTLAREELLEWLYFQCWYELESAKFIGSWLYSTPEPEAFAGLCRQIADESRHYAIIAAHIRTLGGSMEGWAPEPEWVRWIQEFYAREGSDTLERMGAHNITGEIGAMNAFAGLLPRVPESTRAVLERITPDEQFHVSLGRAVVHRYAVTAEAQQRIERRAWQAFEHEQKGRLAFERRLSRLGPGARRGPGLSPRQRVAARAPARPARGWRCRRAVERPRAGPSTPTGAGTGQPSPARGSGSPRRTRGSVVRERR